MRVPSNRAGKSARCPGCKTVVVVPFPPGDYRPTELLQAPAASSAITNELNEVNEVANAKSVDEQTKPASQSNLSSSAGSAEPAKDSRAENPTNVAKTNNAIDLTAKTKSRKPAANQSSPSLFSNQPAANVSERAKAQKKDQSDSVSSTATTNAVPHSVPKPDLEIAQKTDKRKKKKRSKTSRESLIAAIEPAAIIEPESPKPLVVPIPDEVDPIQESVEISTAGSNETSKLEPSFDAINIALDADDKPIDSSGINPIEVRTRRANEDRVTLTRFFAGFLVFVGLVNFAPAIYCWYSWAQLDPDFIPPRWIYLQIFIAVLHLVYAVLLLQVPDWSTLRSIAIVMLSFAFVFGLFSMGLLTSGSSGLLAQFLQVPSVLANQACIWCVAMLCLATLASYLAGRESSAWQRTEQLLAEILAKKETAEA